MAVRQKRLRVSNKPNNNEAEGTASSDAATASALAHDEDVNQEKDDSLLMAFRGLKLCVTTAAPQLFCSGEAVYLLDVCTVMVQLYPGE